MCDRVINELNTVYESPDNECVHVVGKTYKRRISFEMIRRQMSDTHGFTLVELIVVLVIIAVLAAAVGPAFLGYIDKARMNSTLNDAKKIYLAAQSIVEQAHNDLVDPASRITQDKISELSGITFEEGTTPYHIVYERAYNSTNPANKMYVISTFTYNDGTYTAEYHREGTDTDKEIWTITEN